MPLPFCGNMPTAAVGMAPNTLELKRNCLTTTGFIIPRPRRSVHEFFLAECWQLSEKIHRDARYAEYGDSSKNIEFSVNADFSAGTDRVLC
jgi:hypothetical protein